MSEKKKKNLRAWRLIFKIWVGGGGGGYVRGKGKYISLHTHDYCSLIAVTFHCSLITVESNFSI